MPNQTRMLTLYAPVKPDATGQLVARFVKDGFKAESWDALAKSGSVYEARITALPDPNTPDLLSALLLCTTYEGPAPEYHRFFWDKLTLFFVLVAFAAQDSPFTEADLTAEQLAAFKTAEGLLLASDSAVDPDVRAKARASLPAAMSAVTTAMNKDDSTETAVNPSKFTRFSNWVRKHDLTGSFGEPGDVTMPGEVRIPDKDLHVSPVDGGRNQFVAPNLPIPPWPDIEPG